ncbi:MAG: ergothioneine biosynthesis glutamate--cysteine ligase EgtA, partial [Mycobacterium sp.]
PRIRTAANRCVAAAAERAPAELEEAMQRLVAEVEQGRCPADDMSDRVIENGIAATVTQLARGEL